MARKKEVETVYNYKTPEQKKREKQQQEEAYIKMIKSYDEKRRRKS